MNETIRKLLAHQGNQAAGALLKAEEFIRAAGAALVREDYSAYEQALHEAVSELDTSRWHAARASGMKIGADQK